MPALCMLMFATGKKLFNVKYVAAQVLLSMCQGVSVGALDTVWR